MCLVLMIIHTVDLLDVLGLSLLVHLVKNLHIHIQSYYCAKVTSNHITSGIAFLVSVILLTCGTKTTTIYNDNMIS